MALAPLTPIEPLPLADLVAGRGLVHLERLPARAARFGELATPLPDLVWERLGVDRLWTHQAAAIDEVRAGRSVVLATGTASGKSLCYQAPIAEAALAPLRPSTALCIFPTKALAQDQARALFKLDLPGLVPATYDGDSSTEERTWARGKATVLLTNPEMLHAALLPHHAKWSTYLGRLEHVVVDELHVLRGIFGTHVAHLLRRLRRVCNLYGSDPTFVFCSATIGRPGRLASELCGLPVTEITDDASPKGERLVALWNPAVEAEVDIDLTDHDDGREPEGPKRSTNKETADLVARMVLDGHRTIAFCRSRRGAEVVATEVQRRLPRELRNSVAAYRGGYLAAERREIEADLFSGRLRAVVATTALELGIDVGGLDACILNGFPGTIASLWQQAGRAGREGQESVAVLVAGNDQLDQWLMANPTEVFTRPPEPAVINPSNPYVLLPHLACAAYEHPLTPADERWWGDLLDDGVRRLVLGRPAPPPPPAGLAPPPSGAARAGPPTASACAAGSPPRSASSPATVTTTSSSAPSTRAGRPARSTPVRSTSTRGGTGGSPSWTSTPAERWWSPTTGTSGPSPGPRPTCASPRSTPSGTWVGPTSPSGASRSAARSSATADGTRPRARPWATRSWTCPPST